MTNAYQDPKTKLETAKRRLATLDKERAVLLNLIGKLEKTVRRVSEVPLDADKTRVDAKSSHPVANASSQADKIALFRSFFRGRDDVYALRFESSRTGKSGYQPACKNEWIGGLCRKPRIKCTECDNRRLLPMTDEVIRQHILGQDPRRPGKDFTVGVYPLLPDDKCWFLAIDFDKATWTDDVMVFVETCRLHGIQPAMERSQSGNGAHVWFFFSDAIEAGLARRLGSTLITETMERRPEMGLDSYDRLFPNQDIMPKGGFGNLIALPFQRNAVSKGNTVFLDDGLAPFQDQWMHLGGIRRLDRNLVEAIVEEAARQGKIMGVRMVAADGAEDDPWTLPPSRRKKEPRISGPLPQAIAVVLANQIYIKKAELSPSLINRLIRLAAFQNPEFYRNQAMRLPVYKIPRIISCAEDIQKYIGLPIGCLDDLRSLFADLGVAMTVTDERKEGAPIDVVFQGQLRPEQVIAAREMLHHDIGVLAAGTAFGKTVVAIYLLAKRGVNTLILVHRKQLMDQWANRIATFLGLDISRIGLVGGGKSKPTGKIDIGMIQSLCRKGVVNDIVANYGHLIVDECHHISAPSFEQVARRSSAKFITGLSATVTRQDGHHPIIFMQCGPIRYRTDARKEAAKRPFEHKVMVRETAFSMPVTEGMMIHDFFAAMTFDQQRNAMIVDDVFAAVKAGRCPVVLTERRQHLDLLAGLLNGRVKNLVVLSGGMGSKRRRQTAERMAVIPATDERVILATGKYLGEGFDDARLDTLFLAMPISWKGTLAQYAGRLHRQHDMKKEVVIFDYADVRIPILDRMFRKRLHGYDAIGYHIISAHEYCLPLWNKPMEIGGGQVKAEEILR